MNSTQRKEEFVDLLSRHRSRIFGYIVALVQNTADAEDLFQQACVVLWKKFDEYQPDRGFSQWACKVAQFEALNFIRRNRRSRTYFSDEFIRELATDDARPKQHDDEMQQALAGCLKKLRTTDFQLVDHVYADQFSVKEAAVKLGRPVGAVYKSLNRIRRALLDCVTRTLSAEGSH